MTRHMLLRISSSKEFAFSEYMYNASMTFFFFNLQRFVFECNAFIVHIPFYFPKDRAIEKKI